MIAGYIIENALGLILVLSLFLLRRRIPEHQQVSSAAPLGRHMAVAIRGCDSFHDCAVFFTFSIQLACIVVLARLDFGISAIGMGDSTAKITWAISLLTMLPITYVAFNPGLLRCQSAETPSRNQKSKDRKADLRFLLFALCLLLFIYPFLSRMMETFGPSMIGGNNKIISTKEWDVIQSMCLANVDPITSNEVVAMDVFSVAGSLFVCSLGLGKVIWLAIKKHHGESRFVQYFHNKNSKWMHSTQLALALFVPVPLIAVSQLWTVFRLRRFQEQVSANSGNVDLDAQWTFGQIVAVTIFVPVLVECWFTWLCGRDWETSESGGT